MKIGGSNLSVGITIGDGQGLSSRSRTTVENAETIADKGCHELRSFVLNNKESRSEGSSSRDVPALDSSRRGQESSGSEFNSFRSDLLVRFRATETDCGHGNRLIVLADAKCGVETVGAGPAFDQP